MESWLSLLTSLGLIAFFLGIALMVLGIFLTMAKNRTEEKTEKESQAEDKRSKVRGGGVVLIGPIPIIFGSDRKTLLIAIIASLIFTIIYLLFLMRS
jgi:uncharacterized protein (TIGR00304 family)